MNNILLAFPNNLHTFEKFSKRKNKEGEHRYVCKSCGIVGWLKDNSDTILIKKGSKAMIEKCDEGGKTEANFVNENVGKEIKITKQIDFGDGIILNQGDKFPVVECPGTHQGEHKLDIWIEVPDKEGVLQNCLLEEDEYEFVAEEVERVPAESPPPIEEAPIEPEEVKVEIEGEKPQGNLPEIEETAEMTKEEFDGLANLPDKPQTADEIDQTVQEIANKRAQKLAKVVEPVKVDRATKADGEWKTGIVKTDMTDIRKDRYMLTEEDKLKYGDTMANAELEVEELEEELKDFRKDINSQIDDKRKAILRCGEALRNGFEYKDISCDIHFNYDTGKKLFISNGNTVATEDMTPSDFQMDWGYEKKEEKC